MNKLLSFILFIALLSCGGSKGTDTTAVAANEPVKAAKTVKQTNRVKAAKAVKPTNAVRPVQKVQGAAPVTRNVTATPNTASQNKNAQQKPYGPKNKGWHINLEKAFAESQKTGKPIMANFTGSDWCGWCKKLDRSVFHQPGFDKWAKDNVVLLELDFPRRFQLPPDIAQQNRGLQQSFGVRGYPTIWLFDLDKDDTGKFGIKALGKTGYVKTLGEFQQTMGGYIEARG